MFINDLDDVISYLEFQKAKGLRYVQISDSILNQLFENKSRRPLPFSQAKLLTAFQTTVPTNLFPSPIYKSSKNTSAPFILNTLHDAMA